MTPLPLPRGDEWAWSRCGGAAVLGRWAQCSDTSAQTCVPLGLLGSAGLVIRHASRRRRGIEPGTPDFPFASIATRWSEARAPGYPGSSALRGSSRLARRDGRTSGGRAADERRLNEQ